jgi:hypothetical protein
MIPLVDLEFGVWGDCIEGEEPIAIDSGGGVSCAKLTTYRGGVRKAAGVFSKIDYAPAGGFFSPFHHIYIHNLQVCTTPLISTSYVPLMIKVSIKINVTQSCAMHGPLPNLILHHYSIC